MSEQEARDMFDEGKAAFDRSDWETAGERFRAALDHPDLPADCRHDVAWDLGLTWLHRRDVRQARFVFDAAEIPHSEWGPKADEIIGEGAAGMGRVYLEQGLAEAASGSWGAAAEQFALARDADDLPESYRGDLWYNYGIALIHLEQREEASDAFKMAGKSDAEFQEMWDGVNQNERDLHAEGAAAYGNGDYATALQIWGELLLSAEPDVRPAILYNLGLAYLRTNEPALAESAFRQGGYSDEEIAEARGVAGVR